MPVLNSKHYLCTVAAAFFVSPPLHATDAEDAIAACARISSTGDRIICLEDALRRLSPAEAESTSAMTLPDVDDEAQTAVNEDPPAAKPVEMPPAVDDEVQTMAPVPGFADVADRATAAAAPAVTTELGAEQVALRTNEEAKQVRIRAKIVAHELVGTGRLRLTLDNGQIWQQTGDDDDRIARKLRGEDNIAIEMWQSRSGGYRMHLVDIDRTLRVRRIR